MDYKLYKSVFCNKYISDLIFKNVYILNDQYGGKRKSFTRCVNYEQASLEWILKNEKYELLYDKIKSNYRFSENDEGFSFVWIKKLVQLFTSDKENNNIILLQKFYNNNLDTLKRVKLVHCSTNFMDISLLEFSIHTQSIDFLKLVYEDYKTQSISTKSENENIGLLDLSLKLGNLDIIKFVHREMGINLKNKIMALHFSMLSENRSDVVYYLLDEIKYKPPTEKEYPIETILDKFFLNLMKLEFDLFNRLHKLGSPLFFNRANLNSLCFYFNNIFELEENKKPFNQFLNFFQNCILLSTILSNSRPTTKRNSLLLKKIRHLIKYNNNNNNNNNNNKNDEDEDEKNNIYTLEQDEYITMEENENDNDKENEKKDTGKNGNWFSNLLKSKSKSTTTKTTTTNTSNTTTTILEKPEKEETNNDKFSDINYDNFNFEREINRIYLFDYLEVEKENFMSIDSYMLMVLEFKRKYQERVVFDDASFLNSGCSYESLFVVSIVNADYKLLKFDSSDILQKDQHLKELKQGISSIFYKRRLVSEAFSLASKDIEKQIKYIDFLYKKKLCSEDTISALIDKIVLSKYFNVSQHSEPLINVIKKYYFQTKKSSAAVFVHNRELFIYYNKKYFGLFDWTSEIIAKWVVKNDDIELIEYLHINRISNLNLAIDFCQTLKTAEYLVKLGYTFSRKSLETISSLDNSDETFSIFQLAFKSLIDTKIISSVDDEEPTNGKQKIEDLIPISFVSKNYRCLKFLEENVLLGILHPSKVNILFSSPKRINLLTIEKLLPFFNSLYDINNVLDTFNYDIIDSFLNEYKSNHDNKNQTKYNLEIKKTNYVKIMKLHKSFKIRSLIEENINNNYLSVN
ncbi:hypothetical protein ACTFIU_007541 [Dictyostelium citrinum]